MMGVVVRWVAQVEIQSQENLVLTARSEMVEI